MDDPAFEIIDATPLCRRLARHRTDEVVMRRGSSRLHLVRHNIAVKRYVFYVLFVAVILPLLGGCGLADRIAGRKQYSVSSEVMEPTIKAGGEVTATQTEGRYVPKLGDVILFKTPMTWGGTGIRIARVIGVPGTAVRCCDGQGRTTLNGNPLEEPYLKEPPASRIAFGPVTVPEGRVWVQGDNRHVSLDSRSRFLDPSNRSKDDSMVLVSSVVAVADLAAVE
ncbi:signal peptidase I [Streptosporangium sp. NPDC023825]|uniref:signal peptidase I n=1 Tax=Streptosporangium sp. NPDC023825 TaxID=3154909 RepID=UPI00341748C0